MKDIFHITKACKKFKKQVSKPHANFQILDPLNIPQKQTITLDQHK